MTSHVAIILVSKRYLLLHNISLPMNAALVSTSLSTTTPQLYSLVLSSDISLKSTPVILGTFYLLSLCTVWHSTFSLQHNFRSLVGLFQSIHSIPNNHYLCQWLALLPSSIVRNHYHAWLLPSISHISHKSNREIFMASSVCYCKYNQEETKPLTLSCANPFWLWYGNCKHLLSCYYSRRMGSYTHWYLFFWLRGFCC